MHERLLTIDVLVVKHRGEQDRRVGMVGHGNDHRIKFVDVFFKSLAVILTSERIRVGVDAVAVGLADGPEETPAAE